MQANEMIMVIMNEKGTERNLLVDYNDYVENFILKSVDNRRDAITMATEIADSRSKDGKWREWYWAGNKSFQARYCSGMEELEAFLTGLFNDGKEWCFDEGASSKSCMESLEERGIKADGSQVFAEYSYQKANKVFQPGEILHNFNGKDYRVMEKYSDENLLLLDLTSGNFVVAKETEYYVRTPKYSNDFPKDAEHGIEWGHGIYLSAIPSKIDFQALRAEHCQPYKQQGEEFQIEIREILSRVQNIRADTLGDAIDKAMEMYDKEQIVLDSSDYKGVDYLPMEHPKR